MAVQISVDSGDYVIVRDSSRRTVLAENRAPRTIATYLAAVDELGRYLALGGCRGFSRTSGASTSSRGSQSCSSV